MRPLMLLVVLVTGCVGSSGIEESFMLHGKVTAQDTGTRLGGIRVTVRGLKTPHVGDDEHWRTTGQADGGSWGRYEDGVGRSSCCSAVPNLSQSTQEVHVTLVFDDVDGPANGGAFQSSTVEVTIQNRQDVAVDAHLVRAP